ncbi:MAG TPA: 30S ribosomal protein S15 [Bacteroidales bacterium]|nr:30S ribosomal protein S15 [Bacteroidales bacterium]
MYLTPEIQKGIFAEASGSETNTGSAESQVSLFTYKISHLTNHLKGNKKDKVTQRSLILMVGKRRKLLDYLKSKDIERYRSLIKKLNLRK